jgi:hypothetical protein
VSWSPASQGPSRAVVRAVSFRRVPGGERPGRVRAWNYIYTYALECGHVVERRGRGRERCFCEACAQ